jgi:uncharacterized protein (TIGR03083 family)
VDNSSLIEAVQAEAGHLIEAVGAGPTSATVPTCEGWTVNDLATHVGAFCGFWTHVLCEAEDRPKTPFSEPGPSDDLASWLVAVTGHLVGALSSVPASTEVWTWFDADHTAGFVTRRSAHELAVHRFDAQSARGTCSPIAGELAEDGIDEILHVLVNARDRTGEGSGRSLGLHSTDTDAVWDVRLESDRIDVDRSSATLAAGPPSDLALHGTASDLELLLYNRPPLGTVDYRGDQSVLDAWYREFAF